MYCAISTKYIFTSYVEPMHMEYTLNTKNRNMHEIRRDVCKIDMFSSYVCKNNIILQLIKVMACGCLPYFFTIQLRNVDRFVAFVDSQWIQQLLNIFGFKIQFRSKCSSYDSVSIAAIDGVEHLLRQKLFNYSFLYQFLVSCIFRFP